MSEPIGLKDDLGQSTNPNRTLAEVLEFSRRRIDEMNMEPTIYDILYSIPFSFWIIATFGAILGGFATYFFVRAKRNSKPKNNTKQL